jgi:hypothetical protein
MTNYNPTELFKSIKQSLVKDETSIKVKDYLKTEVGNTYTVRLIPNIEDPAKTFFHYYTHNFKSFATGENIFVPSLATWGERDPIAEQRYQISKNGSESEKEKVKAIKRNESWLVNVYVINDPVNSENNGKIKILRFGKQLKKLIDDAMGEEADEYGQRIFDLSPNGCNFKIKVEKQGDYPTYVSSKFQSPKEIEGLAPDKYEGILKGALKLEDYVTAKSFDSLKQLFDQHYHCKGDVKKPTAPAQTTETPKIDAAPGNGPIEEVKPVSSDDPKIKKLLEGLDS